MTRQYPMPQMPLEADVWYLLPKLPPEKEPDATIFLSLSPVRPEDFLRAGAPWGTAQVSHIIRCEPDGLMGDNSGAFQAGNLFPTTVFEVPPGSQHWYLAVWYHECGAGFSNHHARVYVTRFTPFFNPDQTIFQGWI